jgi:ABC-2 type transport system permease protein
MRSCELCETRTAVRSGKAIAAIYIPENFEWDIIRGRRRHVTVLYNKRFFATAI